MNPYIQKTIDFLINEVGIPVSIEDGVKGFAGPVIIRNGELVISPECHPSALLHEAGHLAITPADFRHLMDGNLYQSFKEIDRIVTDLDLDPEHIIVRAFMQMSDPEATAWAWAAGKHLGIPEEDIILDSEYDNSGKLIRMQLSMNGYLGINGIASAGFCKTSKRLANYSGEKCFPELNRWAHPVYLSKKESTLKIS